MKENSSIPNKQNEADTLLARNATHLRETRWHLLIYPYGRKHLSKGLEREIARRKATGEKAIEYFAPHYVEAREEDGRIVTTSKNLFENYVFVHASIQEIFVMKRYEPSYNLPRKVTLSNGETFYPYVSDETIQNLRWIADAYAGKIPILVDDLSCLVKGDRVRIVSGPLKRMEATLYKHPRSGQEDVIVTFDQWMTVPLVHIHKGQYKVIGLNENADKTEVQIGERVLTQMHNALLHYHTNTLSADDRTFVASTIAQYATAHATTDVMRCKLYALLIMAYTIARDGANRDALLQQVQLLLPAVKAEQAKAFLLTHLYGATDSNLFYRQAHQLVDPWREEPAPKKCKQVLIEQINLYDKYLNH